MKQIILLFAIMTVLSCKSEVLPEVLHETYDFSIQLPKGWKHEKLQGIDSRIGIFTNHKETLSYDFGWYTRGFDSEFGQNPEYIIQKVTVDKRPGQFLYPKNNKNGTTGILLQVDEYNSLTIRAKTKSSQNYYWDIFKTIKFTEK